MSLARSTTGGHMISQQQVDQAFTDLRATCGGLREDYFGPLYLEREHDVPRETLSFLRTDTAFEKCMGIAHGK